MNVRQRKSMIRLTLIIQIHHAKGILSVNLLVLMEHATIILMDLVHIADAKKVSPPCKDENIINDSMSLVGFAIDSVALYATHLNAILRVYGEHGTP